MDHIKRFNNKRITQINVNTAIKFLILLALRGN